MSLLSRVTLIIVATFLLGLPAVFGYTLPAMNMPYGVTPISHEVYHLHMIAFYTCVVIGVAVFGVLIYSLFKYRRSKGAVAAQFHEHVGVEIIWTVIPFIILVVMAVPATK